MEVQPWMNNGVKIVDNPQAIQIGEEFLEKLRTENLENSK
jgi:hypothetical protein